MRTGRDLARRRVLRVDRERRAAGRRRAAMGEQEARDPVGERRLADALRAADQPGVVQAPGGERVEERRLAPRHGRRTPSARADAACRRAGPARGDRCQPAWAFRTGAAAAISSPKRSSTAAQTCSSTLSGRARRIDDDAALGLVGGDAQESLAQALVEADVLGLEAIDPLGPRPSARRGPGQPDLGRHVEDEGQVRLRRVDDDPLEARQELRLEPAVAALVGPRRIGEAVAQHEGAALERRADRSPRDGRAAPPRTAAPRRAGRAALRRRTGRRCGCARRAAIRRARAS